jgi:hypothetical protein
LQIGRETIDRAFEASHLRYVANATRAWDLDHHVRLWADARRSVESSDDAGFLQTLSELRSHWQIARGKGAQMLLVESVPPLLRSTPHTQRQNGSRPSYSEGLSVRQRF